VKIEFDFDRCIYCLRNKADSWEHIIPGSIGGRLQVRILCSDCNHTFGTGLISKVKSSPTIRLAIRNLKNELLGLYRAIETGQIYDAKGKNEDHIRLRFKNSKFETIAHKKNNGSLVVDTKKGLKNISQMLRKEGLSENKIEDKLQSFQRLEDNKVIQLSETIKVVKWSIDSIFPALQGKLLDEKVIVLIAYEFLSLLIGNLIYDRKLGFIRNFIKKGTMSDKLVIEHLTSRHYDPYHKIYPELLETEIIINIILFRWIVYKVHIKGFKLSTVDFVYLEDLINKKSLIAKSVDEAKQGIYY